MKALTEYTDRELLRHFDELFREYDSLRDEELDFLADHPNRIYWSDEEDETYEKLLNDINDAYVKIREMSEFVGKLK